MTIMLKKLAIFTTCVLLMGGVSLLARTGGDNAPAYKPVPDFLQLPKDLKLGLTTAVATDKDDNLHVFHRGKRPILVFDKAGKLLRSWGDGLVKTAHGLRIDHEGNVWTTDLGTHEVIKYDPHGKVLLTLGTKNKKGATQNTFNMPADVAVTPAGDVYVADGYGNSRVVKFSKDGKYLLEWGKKGKKPGEFNLVHAVFLDGKGRVYVGDRENNRIQVFDPEGKFLAEWKDSGAPYGLFLEKNQRMLVADGRGNRVNLLDLDGKVLGRWGMKGMAPGAFQMPHGICADATGAIYVAEGDGKRVQKFVKQ
jgi:DNA-binding beta-propeller fold protein YncE